MPKQGTSAYEQIWRHISAYVLLELCKRHPEINACHISLAIPRNFPKAAQERKPLSEELPPRHPAFAIGLAEDIPEEEKQEILRAIASRFFRFEVIGKMQPQMREKIAHDVR